MKAILFEHHGGPEVEVDAAFEVLDSSREDEEVSVAGGAQCGAVAVGVAVDDVGAEISCTLFVAPARSSAAVTVSIAQFGSTRSINAGVAAGIAMHTWITQHGDISKAW